MRHPITEAALQKFVTGRASRQEAKAIVAHLVHGCPTCARTIQALVSPELLPGAYDSAFDRFAEDLLADLDDADGGQSDLLPALAARRARRVSRSVLDSVAWVK